MPGPTVSYKAGVQAAIEKKRQQLAALKAKRSANIQKKQHEEEVRAATTQASATTTSADDILASVSDILGEVVAPTPEPAPAPAPAVETQPTRAASPPPQLSLFSPPPLHIPPTEVITYSKEIQVDILKADEKELWGQRERQLEERLKEERATLKLREAQLSTQLAQVEKERDKLELQAQEIEALKRVMDAKEQKETLSSTEFQRFFSRSSLLVERALAVDATSDYNFIADYSVDDVDKKDGITKTQELVLTSTFVQAKRTKNRPVTSIDWSTHYQELLLTSYAGQEDMLPLDPDGTILVWNTHMTSRPEYYFYCQRSVLTAKFHPGNPKLIVGALESGDLVMWDMREKTKFTPVNRTTVSNGHTHPVYAMSFVPTVNRTHNVITISTDGNLCVWGDDRLHEPLYDLQLRASRCTSCDCPNQDCTCSPPCSKHKVGAAGLSKEEITSTCFDIPGKEINTLILGSDEGYVYKAQLYEHKVRESPIVESFKAHEAPITALACQPTAGSKSDLFLTSSYDWTVKLWSNRLRTPIITFESAKDYVYDVQWSPKHPAVFASGDGTGSLDVWDLSADSEVPTLRTTVPSIAGEQPAISCLRWSRTGKQIAVGASNGCMHLYEVANHLVEPSKNSGEIFRDKIKQKVDEVQNQARAS
eukprot:g24504.t1